MDSFVDPLFVGDERRQRLEGLVDAYSSVVRDGRSRLVVLTAPTGWGKTRIVRELYGRLARSANAYWPPHLDSQEGSWLHARKRVFPAPFDVPEKTPIPYLWLGVSCQKDQMGRELSALQYAERQFQAHVGSLAAALEGSGDRWKARVSAAGALAGLLGLPDPVNMAMTWHGIATSGWEVLAGEWRSHRDRRRGAEARRVDTDRGPDAAERGAELAEQLARLSGPDLPVVLVIDDAHWADSGTVAFVGKLLNSSGHVLLVATAWPDQLTVQSAEVGTFGHALPAWVDAGRAERHDLARLPDAALARMVEGGAGTVDPRVVRALCERADGNPNRVQGLLSLRVVRRALAEGGTSLTQDQIDALPTGDDEIIMAIWRDLPEHVREVLAISTLQGAEFNPDWILAAAELLDLTDVETGLAQAHSPWGWVRALDAALAAFVETALYERATVESRTLFLPDEMTAARTAMLHWAADQKRRPDWDTLSAAARRAILETHVVGAEQGIVTPDADVADSAHRLLQHLEDGEELQRWREVAERGVEWTEGRPASEDLNWTFRRRVADAVALQGDYEGALDRYRALLSGHARVRDPRGEAHLELRHGHAWLLMRTGQADAAVEELDDLIAIWTALHGEGYEWTLRARRRRGLALAAADRPQEAIAEFDRLIELLVESGTEEKEVLHARSCRADALGQAGRVGEAIGELEAVLEAELRRVGKDHPVTLHVRNNLGHWLMVKGRFDEARAIFEELVADRLHILGPDHPGTLTSRGNLASVFGHLGDADRAEALSRRLLQDLHRVLGPDHPTTLVTQSNLAFALQGAGRLEEALVEMTALLEGRERAFGQDDPWTVRTRLNVATLLADTGRADEAIDLLERLAGELPTVFGWGHRLAMQAFVRLAVLLRENGRPDQGMSKLDQIVSERRARLGETAPDTFRAVRERAAWAAETARVDRSPDRVRDALTELGRVVSAHEESLGPRHPLTGEAGETRAQVLEALRSDGWDDQAGTFL